VPVFDEVGTLAQRRDRRSIASAPGSTAVVRSRASWEGTPMTEGQADRAWSEIASWYDELLVNGSGPHETAVATLRRLVPDLTGVDVLDLACGQGLATRALAEAGACSVTGVDFARPMIEIAARRTAADLPISWRVDDAEHLKTFAAASFDGVTCQLGLMDIADLMATLRSVRRVLRPRGWFVFVIGHPCSLAPLGHDSSRRRRTTRTLRNALLRRGVLDIPEPAWDPRTGGQPPSSARRLPQLPARWRLQT
jgi:ubiquinone/menaquinone biosynthesis C-methylase UbiE